MSTYLESFIVELMKKVMDDFTFENLTYSNKQSENSTWLKSICEKVTFLKMDSAYWTFSIMELNVIPEKSVFLTCRRIELYCRSFMYLMRNVEKVDIPI